MGPSLRPLRRFFPENLVVGLIAFAGLTPAEAEVIKAHEPRYAQAVLAYNSRKYEESLKILNQLLKESPGLVEFLELKALALKSAKNDEESAKTYAALIVSKTQAKAKPSEIAPYYFELGVIQFRGKKTQAAAANFEYFLAKGFNEIASRFFLGMIAFQGAMYSKAINHFEEVARSGVADLRGPALFYLGQSYLKISDSSRALASFSEARAWTEGSKEEVAKAIHTACMQILAPLDQSKKFASIALSLSYDSNVQALPNSLDGTLAINKGSLKSLLQAGYGYMSSPTRDFQWVPNYRLLYNYNHNRDTKEAEFLNQYFSLYLNRRPLERSAYGFKADTSVTFQNQFNDNTLTSATYRIFSLTGGLGAYYRTEVSKRITLYAEIGGGPQHYFIDSNLTDAKDKRSGMGYAARLSLTHVSLGRFLNPSLNLLFNEQSTSGTEFFSRGVAAYLANGMIFNDRFRGSLNLGYAPTYYTRRPSGTRIDHNYSFSAEASWQLNPKWSWINDFSISYNDSNVPEIYEYRRWTLSSGLSYSFY
ncbi:hypothetical protein EB061_09725 [bacterium]|nr:hypothetical protein [bacterium]